MLVGVPTMLKFSRSSARPSGSSGLAVRLATGPPVLVNVRLTAGSPSTSTTAVGPSRLAAGGMMRRSMAVELLPPVFVPVRWNVVVFIGVVGMP